MNPPETLDRKNTSQHCWPAAICIELWVNAGKLASKAKVSSARSEPAAIASSVETALKKPFNGESVVVPYLHGEGQNDSGDRKDMIMRFAAIALAAVFALSSTGAFAYTTRHGSKIHRSHHGVNNAQDKLSPNNGNPNGNPNGPTTLSGTGSSKYGGSSAGTSGRN